MNDLQSQKHINDLRFKKKKTKTNDADDHKRNISNLYILKNIHLIITKLPKILNKQQKILKIKGKYLKKIIIKFLFN